MIWQKGKARRLVSYIMIISFRFGKLRGILIIRAIIIFENVEKIIDKNS
jgi:hypothetical protein